MMWNKRPTKIHQGGELSLLISMNSGEGEEGFEGPVDGGRVSVTVDIPANKKRTCRHEVHVFKWAMKSSHQTQLWREDAPKEELLLQQMEDQKKKHSRGGSDHKFHQREQPCLFSHASVLSGLNVHTFCLFHFLTRTLVSLQARIWIIKTAGYNSTTQYRQYNSPTFLCWSWDRASLLANRNSRVAFSSSSLCTLKLSFVAFGRNWLYSCYLGSLNNSLRVWHTMIFFPFHQSDSFAMISSVPTVFPVRLIRTSWPLLLVLRL